MLEIKSRRHSRAVYLQQGLIQFKSKAEWEIGAGSGPQKDTTSAVKTKGF